MNIFLLRLWLFLPLVFSYAKNFHPLHVSTTDIGFNAQDKKLEVVCTIFTDDFESVLSKQNHSKADLSEPKLHHKMDEWVKKYMAAHVRINASEKPVQFNYLGFEKASEAVNVYFESEPILTPKKLSAQISILYDLYDDQMNIVHITVGGKRKSTKLDFPDKAVSQLF